MIDRSIVCLAVFLGNIIHPAVAFGQTNPTDKTDLFESKVRPLLVNNCLSCHGEKLQQGGLRLDSRASMIHGGSHGPGLKPGDANNSPILQAVRYAGPIKMPPAGKLKPFEIQAIEDWVRAGAFWPAERAPAGKSVGRVDHSSKSIRPSDPLWSLQPITKVPLPRVKRTDLCWTSIDRFIVANLENNGLSPSPLADRRTLIRRATFDLTGLPPTPEEVAGFLADRKPDAFARIVDRLLESKAYGERWGRHWLDVVRYADTAGETADYPVPDAWRYRNYVIDSFNQDKPFDQFIREQIAGDILAQSGPREKYAERVIATGYLAIARRFGFDPQNYHHLTIDDTIDTLGRSILGLSLGCARCHDHKYDPVTSKDYYALYGIFDSTRYAFSGAEETKRQRDLVPMVPPAEADDLSKLGKSVEKAYAVCEAKPHNAQLHKRGDPKDLGDEIPRRFLACLGGQEVPPTEGGSGRLELANWLTDAKNPLTSRVIVNRAWQYHFGKGIVQSPNDFGYRGKLPTHSALLDYLAARLRDAAPAAGSAGSGVQAGMGWSIKKLHREIMLSRVYQQAGAENAGNSAKDPHNDYLWRFDRRRLDADEIRDSILAVSGVLDLSTGGPHPFPPENTWGFTQHAPFEAVYETNRRSVYLMVQRNRRHPFLALFDGADPNSSTGQRRVTTVPTQALFFMNDPFVHAQSEKLAARLLESSANDAGRISLAYNRVYGRPPKASEIAAAQAYLKSFNVKLSGAGIAKDQRDLKAWASLSRILFASSEFVYLD